MSPQRLSLGETKKTLTFGPHQYCVVRNKQAALKILERVVGLNKIN